MSGVALRAVVCVLPSNKIVSLHAACAPVPAQHAEDIHAMEAGLGGSLAGF